MSFLRTAVILESVPDDFSARFHVAGCIIESDGEMLLLHRQDKKPQGDTWCLPAGKVDPGETPLEAIMREAWEETGIRLHASTLSHLRSVPVRYTDYDFIYHVFFARYAPRPDVVINLIEHKAYRWVAPRDALSMRLIEDEEPCLRLVYDI